MAELIEHDGVIESIDNHIAMVRISQKSACAGCHAHGSCPAAESKVKLVEAHIPNDGNTYNVGSHVVILAQRSVGLIAVLLCCVVPVLLMLLTLFIAQKISGSDIVAGISSLAVLLPYLLILRLTRHKMKSRLTFSITPKA